MLTMRMADAAAMQAYLQQIGGNNSALHAAFRTAFFAAMRDTLTARQYEALCLHYIGEKTQREIAALWGISPSAVCKHIKQAKRRLAVLLSYNLELRGELRS